MKKYFFILLSIIVSLPVIASINITVDSIFSNCPKQIMPLLDKNQRMKLLDLYNYKLNTESFNLLEGKSKIIYKNNNFLQLQLTPISYWELKVLSDSLTKNIVLAIVKTYKTIPSTSFIFFYSKEWKKLNLYPPSPSLSDFIQPLFLNNEDWSNIKKMLHNSDITYQWSAKHDILKLKLSIIGLSKEQQKQIKPFMQEISYQWNGKEFIKITSNKKTIK